MTLPRVIPHFFVLVVLFAAANAWADWINLTGAQNARNIAEIYVNDDHVKLVLEIHVGDLDTFEALLPDDFFKKGGTGRPPAEDRVKRFSQETFRIIKDEPAWGLKTKVVNITQ